MAERDHCYLMWDFSNGKSAWPRLSQSCLHCTLRLFLSKPPFTGVSYASWPEVYPHILLLLLIFIFHRHFPSLELLILSLASTCKRTHIYTASKFWGDSSAIDNETDKVWYGCCHNKSLKHVASALALHGRQKLEGPGGERPEGLCESVRQNLKGLEEVFGGAQRKVRTTLLKAGERGILSQKGWQTVTWGNTENEKCP